MKLLSEDPDNYPDAPREAIRRIMQEVCHCNTLLHTPHSPALALQRKGKQGGKRGNMKGERIMLTGSLRPLQIDFLFGVHS